MNSIKKLIVILMLVSVSTLTFADEYIQTIRLSALDLKYATQQYGTLVKGTGFDGRVAMVAGVKCSDVVCVHSNSVMRMSLGRTAKTFECNIGVADNSVDYQSTSVTMITQADGKKLYFNTNNGQRQFLGVEGAQSKVNKGRVTFRIVADGKTVYKNMMNQGEPLQHVSIKLDGVSVLDLIVDDGGDGPSGDFAYWTDAEIRYSGKSPTMVETKFEGEAPQISEDALVRLNSKIAALPKVELPLQQPQYDWLINASKAKAQVCSTPDGKGVVLTNGLVARIFRVLPNLATVDIVNQMTGENMLRAVSSEGTLSLNGNTYTIGGLTGQEERGYLEYQWIDKMASIPGSFVVEDMTVEPVKPLMKWKRARWALNNQDPTGKSLVFTLRGPGEKSDIVVRLHYDIYDGIPTIRKRMEVINESQISVKLDSFKLEQLNFIEEESPVGGDPALMDVPNISVESNYEFAAGTMYQKFSNQTVRWVKDPKYTSQCNYGLETPCVLEVALPYGPDITIVRGDTFTSMDVYETPYDSYDKERQGLFKRRFYRTVAPWLTQNPIFLHLISTDTEVVHRAIDQCAECGYEMIILSFGSGVDMETNDPKHIEKLKGFADYAHSKGIEIGGYSLLASRWISDDVDVINPKTGKRGDMTFGSSPCLCSEWGYNYFEKIRSFYDKTGFSVFENDGSYSGDPCASTTHKFHNGLADSQWKQWKQISGLYEWMQGKGIYMNVPDYYFLVGSSKIGIGYREANWSLPRDRQLILGRQVDYRGTYDRMASSCWTFVPLTEYQGGGAAATLEPLSEHLAEYRQHMVQNYGAGIQACYRGPRLYDTEATKNMVCDVIDWYKKYRTILNSDIIHLRQPDGRDWDGFMHVNPDGSEKALAIFFNPTDQPMRRTVKLPLYYTGLTSKASIRKEEGKTRTYKLNRDYTVNLTVDIPAHGYVWYVVE